MSVNLRAFLAMLRWAETGSVGPDSYWVQVGGARLPNLDDHPRQVAEVKFPNGLKVSSSAAGAYQFLASTWDRCKAALSLPDFSPKSQDEAAIWLIKQRGALADVEAGRLREALEKCSWEWASLPPPRYGQPGKTYEDCERVFRAAGGFLSTQEGGTQATHGTATDQAAPPAPSTLAGGTLNPNADAGAMNSARPAPDHAKEIFGNEISDLPPPAPPLTPSPKRTGPEGGTPEARPAMTPLAATAIGAVIEAIPSLVRLFGKDGSRIVERNAKAVEIVGQVLKEATGEQSPVVAAEKALSDPPTLAKVEQAAKARWYDLSEAGGGGIEGARAADFKLATDPNYSVTKSPSFWVALMLLPLVYLIVLSVIGVLGPVEWDAQTRAALAGLIVGGIVGALTGYYFGTVTSRNR